MSISDPKQPKGLAEFIRQSARPEEPEDIFYDELMGIPETRLFLEHKIVDKNLKSSLYRWMLHAVEPKDQDGIEESSPCKELDGFGLDILQRASS